ncbi:hypothetical protein HanIR_Chr02g0053431 [Helianthus annuus]|nr:hypothetical protein HanIR_Chr02g0053431 [Helianthus annuus]
MRRAQHHFAPIIILFQNTTILIPEQRRTAVQNTFQQLVLYKTRCVQHLQPVAQLTRFGY